MAQVVGVVVDLEFLSGAADARSAETWPTSDTPFPMERQDN